MYEKKQAYSRWRPLLGLGLGWMLMVTGSARADWLVTSDGVKLATEGAWRVDGERVIFARPGGMLSSLRLSEVDLEASRHLNARQDRSEVVDVRSTVSRMSPCQGFRPGPAAARYSFRPVGSPRWPRFRAIQPW